MRLLEDMSCLPQTIPIQLLQNKRAAASPPTQSHFSYAAAAAAAAAILRVKYF
jgi:hypothetical protein